MKSLAGSIAATLAIAGCGVSDPVDPTAGQPVEQPAPPSSTTGAAARRYTIIEVPAPVPSGHSSVSKLVCNTGGVVGNASITSIVGEHAITFDGSRLTDLGTLGGESSTAHGGNARGTVVGGSGTAPSGGGGGSGPGHAFVVRDGVMTDLGGLGGRYSEAWAINAREQIVGSSTVVPTPGDVPSHAALWDGCTATDLGTLGGTESWARGINDAGVIAGAALLPDGRAHAVVWRGGAIVDLGAGDAEESQATAINAAGAVAGFTRSPDRAVVWRHDELVDLGTLGGTHATALGLDEAGDVVGASTDASQARFRAFLYTNGEMIDLEAALGDPRWTLIEATDVCNDGRIAGNGLLDGLSRGYILIPN